MKVLHVVTYISKGSEFGGPAQVAINLVEEFRKLHECEIIALSNTHSMLDHQEFPTDIYHLQKSYRIFKRIKFAGILNLRIYFNFLRKARKFDLVHIHLARDLVTLPLALICCILKIPYVLQCHGMIDQSERKSARFLDLLATRRILRNSSMILSLSAVEDADLRSIENQIKVTRFVNASKVGPSSLREEKVLFIGRLSEEKKPETLVRAGILLLESGYNLRFEFIGPDQGNLRICTSLLSDSRHREFFFFHGSLSNENTLKLLSKSKVFVLPSPKDRFPLSVVESLSTSTPVVVSPGNGLAEYVEKYDAGVVCEVTESAIAEAISKILANEFSFQQNAKSLFQENLNIDVVIKDLEKIYFRIITEHDEEF